MKKQKNDNKTREMIKNLTTDNRNLEDDVRGLKVELSGYRESIDRIAAILDINSGYSPGGMYHRNNENLPLSTLIVKEIMRLKAELAREDESSTVEVEKSRAMYELLRIALRDQTLIQEHNLKQQIAEKVSEGKLPPQALRDVLNQNNGKNEGIYPRPRY